MTEVFVASSTEGRQYAEIVAQALQSHGTIPILWWSQRVFPLGTTLIEALVEISERASGAVIILTPDDRTVRRGVHSYSPAQNVLLEYGLFAGSLGRANVAILKVGDPMVPSDLDGVVHIRMRQLTANDDIATYQSVELGPALGVWLNSLEASSSQGARLAALTRRVAPTAKPDDRLRIKSRLLGERVDAQSYRQLTSDALEHLLLKHTFGNSPDNRIGYEVTSEVSSYLALTRVVPGSEDERALAAHLASHVAQLIASHEIEPTVLAISKNAAISLLQSTAQQLRYPVIMVGPYGPNRESPVEGFYEVGDRAVLLHDVVLSGHHLVDCIATLRDAGLYANQIVTLAQHHSDDAELRAVMQRNDIALFRSALFMPAMGRVFCGTPSVAADELAVLDCVLCDVVAEKKSTPVWSILNSYDVESEVLLTSPHFIVVADVAPLAPGHVLIVTKDHRISMSKCSSLQLEELEALASRVHAILAESYSLPVVVFEHGLCNRARASGCGIDHAHLHLVPLKQSIAATFQRDFHTELLPTLLDLPSEAARGEEYLLLGKEEGGFHMAFAEGPTRQYFRRVISTMVGRDLWNWNDELLLGRKTEVREWLIKVHQTFADQGTGKLL